MESRQEDSGQQPEAETKSDEVGNRDAKQDLIKLRQPRIEVPACGCCCPKLSQQLLPSAARWRDPQAATGDNVGDEDNANDDERVDHPRSFVFSVLMFLVDPVVFCACAGEASVISSISLWEQNRNRDRKDVDEDLNDPRWA